MEKAERKLDEVWESIPLHMRKVLIAFMLASFMEGWMIMEGPEEFDIVLSIFLDRLDDKFHKEENLNQAIEFTHEVVNMSLES